MPPSPDSNPLKVVLVEDHQMFREWLAQMIAKDRSFVVCGEADNIKDAMQVIEKCSPDIAIVDLTLRGSSGLELIKDLKAHAVNVPILVLSMHDEWLYAERVLRAGARGYITKNEATSTLLKAIRRVLSAQVYLSDAMTAKVLAKVASPRASMEAAGMESLADRELEVFQLLGRGLNTRAIAAELHLGEATVDTCRTRIKDKLYLRDAAELHNCATRWVRQKGRRFRVG